MRNLSLCAKKTVSIPNARISAAAVDVERDVVYAASEHLGADGGIEVEIWKIVLDGGDHSVLAMLPPVTAEAGIPHIVVVAFRVLPETRMLSLISRQGDITTVSLPEEDGDEDGESTIEVEGTVDSGILAASWSPDDSLLVLTTGDGKLILMTSVFEILSEIQLHALEFGEGAPINVGWGSKQTQFHGSLGKAAAQAPSDADAAAAAAACSPDDDALPRVSWRGDGAYFAVSSLSPPNTAAGPSPGRRRRVLRVYDRQAVLQSTSEPVAGLEHPLAWRPSGNLIAGTQRFGFDGGGAGREGRHDVVFFERNGLRHGEFGLRAEGVVGETGGELRWGYKVRELGWSCTSGVLSVWIERDEGDIVQLWTTGNYHWYLKQEIAAPSSSDNVPSHFTSVNWHPEQPLTLILTTSTEVIQRTYAWEIYSSPSKPPGDSASVAVLDGSNILLTPFRIQNVPPPMSSCQLSLSAAPPARTRTPIHVSFLCSRDILAVLWVTGRVELWDLRTRLEPGRSKVMDPEKVWEGFLGEECPSRQVKLLPTDHDRLAIKIGVLGSARDGGCDVITYAKVEDGKAGGSRSSRMPGHSGRLVDSDSIFVWQARDGELFTIDFDVPDSVSSVARFPEYCLPSNHVPIPVSHPADDDNDDDNDDDKVHSSVFIGLAGSGKLYLACNTGSSRVLESHVTSFAVTESFVIFTVNSHEAVFVSLAGLVTSGCCCCSQNEDVDIKSGWERRKVERGSRIVTAVPSTMSLVLQMPRGNLETINPRPLVMEMIKQDLDMKSYRKAFLACRKHRIDLNTLVEHNYTVFLENLASFVEQVDDVDHFNLFLTSIGRGSQPVETIARLCDALRVELESRDLEKYVNSILTAYVVKSPPDYEAGLALLLRLREKDPHLVEDAVKYMIFLVDADKLFDTALGMYDFSLVLMIAQHAQKDPREYLPFLRELRDMENKYYQRFKIDDHLGRHETALRNLNLAGSDHFKEAMGYVERYQLHKLALSIWKGTDQYSAVLDTYGKWLFERRSFKKAALVFLEAGVPSKAMVAHEKAMEWQELFDLAARENVSQEDIVAMGYRVAEDLSTKKRYSESARVLLDYSKNTREAVITLVQGNEFSEARRIARLYAVPELVIDIIHPGVLEARAQLAEDINEMREQLQKQLSRICVLRDKKTMEPDAYYGNEDSNLQNVDVMTDVSVPGTTFTRYTVAPSAMSKTSKQSSRSKRKMERKIGSGRKGTVDEEEYLLKSVTKLVGRFETVQGEVANILPHLYQFTTEHRSEGRSLQNDLDRFAVELGEAVEKIWRSKDTEVECGAVPTEHSWASRMGEKEKERLVDASQRVVKPEMTTATAQKWRLFDFEGRWP